MVRRITGKSIGTWFAEEVAKPLEADFFIGLPESEDRRVSNVIPPPPLDLEGMEISEIAGEDLHEPAARRHHGDATPGGAGPRSGRQRHGNARSVAAIQSVIAGQGRSRAACACSPPPAPIPSSRSRPNGIDLVLGMPTRFGMGYGLSNDEMPLGPRGLLLGRLRRLDHRHRPGHRTHRVATS